MNIVPIKSAPRDTANELRRIADRMDAGAVTDLVMVACAEGNYEFTYAASKRDCLVMAVMLQTNCIDRMRTG